MNNKQTATTGPQYPQRTDDLISLELACCLAVGISEGDEFSYDISCAFDRIVEGRSLGPFNENGNSTRDDRRYPSVRTAIMSGELGAFVALEKHSQGSPLSLEETRVSRAEFAQWLWLAHRLRSPLLMADYATLFADGDVRNSGVSGTAQQNRKFNVLAAMFTALAESAGYLKNDFSQAGTALAMVLSQRGDGYQFDKRTIKDRLKDGASLPCEDVSAADICDYLQTGAIEIGKRARKASGVDGKA